MKVKFALIGLMQFYARGLCIPVEVSDLEKLKYRAENGNVQDQVDLGFMYTKGRGVALDYQEAMRWFRKAADQGLAMAQGNMGVIYAKGQGVAQDYQEAMRWFRKAADQGLAEGQYYLGCMYSDGQGVAQDDQEALKWLRKASNQGFAAAQYGLGCMYSVGQGVTMDCTEAYAWFIIASMGGEAEFVGKRDMVSRKMTPNQIAEGKKKAERHLLTIKQNIPDQRKTSLVKPIKSSSQ